jgi:hypothetical protein
MTTFVHRFLSWSTNFFINFISSPSDRFKHTYTINIQKEIKRNMWDCELITTLIHTHTRRKWQCPFLVLHHCYLSILVIKRLLTLRFVSSGKVFSLNVTDEDKLTTRSRATTQSPTAKLSGVSSIPTDKNKAAKSISSKSNPTAKNKVAPNTSSTSQNENAKSSACGTGKNKLRVNSNSPDADNPQAYSW